MELMELWQTYSGELTGYLHKHTNNPDTAEDIASEVFLKAVRCQGLLAGMAPPQCRSWLYTTAKREMIDLFRRKQLEARVVPEPDRFEDDLTVVPVSEFISRLPEDLQELVAMRYFADMDSTAISKELGIPAATVRTRLRKACMLLRKYWQKDEEER